MEESGIYLTKDQILKLFPYGECCDCSEEIADYEGKYKWILYHKKIIYCPKCAENEGWLFEEE